MNIQIEDQPNQTPLAPLRWYVAETEIAQERVTLRRLEERGFEAYLPMRRAGPQAKKVTVVAYFPRYLFVRLGIGTPGWERVYSTVGVRCVLGNRRPLPLADKRIQEIREHEIDGFIPVPKTRKKARFSHGDRLTVASGPFVGFDAIFDETLDERRVWILLKFLGRDSRAVADVHTLRAVS